MTQEELDRRIEETAERNERLWHQVRQLEEKQSRIRGAMPMVRDDVDAFIFIKDYFNKCMTQEEFDRRLSAISDQELADTAQRALSELCKSRGKSFTMSIPPKIGDTDIIFMEAIKRFKEKL